MAPYAHLCSLCRPRFPGLSCAERAASERPCLLAPADVLCLPSLQPAPSALLAVRLLRSLDLSGNRAVGELEVKVLDAGGGEDGGVVGVRVVEPHLIGCVVF